MIGKAIDIPTPDGVMDSYAAYPGGGGPFPLVVLFMDVWGLREELFSIARKVAARGYYCVAPNLFYRDGKVRYEKRNADGKMLSFESLPAEKQAELRGYSAKIDRPRCRVDIAALLDFCRDEPVDGGAAGSFGFCLGGRAVFYAGQEFPERFCANASLHGTWLVTDAPDSAHRLVDRMRGEVYCGYGAHDRFATPEIVAAMAQAFKGRTNVSYRFNLHASAGHGYGLPDRDVYDHEATEADWLEIFAMFARKLATSGDGRPAA
jgi:carboxymethylenebutenolidase